MTTPSDLVMAVSMLFGLYGLVWLASNYLKNREQRDYNSVSIVACLASGLTILDAPLALIYFKVHLHWWLNLLCLLTCIAVFVLASKRIGVMKDGGKWRNPKVKLTLK